MAVAALLVSDPFELWFDAFVFLQRRQCSEEHADRMSATYRVLCPRQILRKLRVGIASTSRRYRKAVHCFMVESSDRLVNRIIGSWRCGPRQANACDTTCWFGIIVCVGKPRPPANVMVQYSVNLFSIHTIMTDQWQKSLEMTKNVSSLAR
jgi:hypothetical protein